jgi:endonuclease/exonuclease/phosphatase (EEP) superfamily protein YafD
VLRRGFRSVHTQAGSGLGATLPRLGLQRLLTTRLDHVLYRGEGLTLIEQGFGREFGSDLKPVLARYFRRREHAGPERSLDSV